MSRTGNIEDIYPLSPMQEGILFHTLYTPNSAGYFEQFSYTLEGDLDVPAFEQAWQSIVARHPVLRTLFAWEKRNQPLQIVRQKVTVPLAYQDWRSYSPSEQQSRLDAFLIADRRQGFDLSKAPLLRLALMRLRERSYQFTWSFHHLLLDGWSSPIILAELFALYEGFLRAESPALPPRRPYRDYIRWLQQQDLSQGEQFWRAYLDGFTTPTPFGVDKPRSKGQAEAYAKQELILPEALSGPLQQLARQHHVTMSTLIQGVWAIILSRYSNESEVVFGTTVSGRAAPVEDIENMVGLFINTLPLRVQVRPEVSFLEWLQALQAQQTERRLYEHSPLTHIQQWSDLPANVPLFESILALGNYPIPDEIETERRSLTISEVRLFEQTNYPLTILVMPGAQSLWRFQYDCHRFDDATITRMLGHIQTLLEAIVADPVRPLGQLSWLTETERQQLLTDWNQPATYEPPRQSIPALFEGQVSRTPESIALVYEDQHLTYAELNRRSNQLAHHLRQSGIKPNDIVAMYMDRSLEMVIGILGILKAGGAYLPLDSAYPAERLAFMLQDAQAPILLTQTRMVDDLPAYQGQILCLDSDWSLLAKANDNNPDTVVAPTDTAYVIYTSGSTGKPKGVLVSHGNVVRLFTSTQHWFNFDQNDVWTLFHSYAFDFSVWEIWGALLYGGRLIVVPYWISRSFEAFYKLLCQEKVTVLNQTPSAFRQLMRAEETAGVAPDLALRYVIFGGEALELESLRPWFERHPETAPQLVNMYGITETTVHVTYRPIQASDLETASGSVIGVPIPDLQLYILDPYEQPVPIGVPGEIYIGGAGVAQGYLNRPELTAERFIPDPFNDRSGSHLYKSGDSARYLSNRDIEYLGRIDHQVKIRGFRIELGEIETVLSQHPAVGEAVAVLNDDAPDDKRLVAYVVPDPRNAFTVQQLLNATNKNRLLNKSLYELPNGMVIAYLNQSETDFMYREIFERRSYLRHGISLDEGACIFDVGANIGLFTLQVGQICNNAKIYAFEPLPPVLEILRLNTTLYNLDAEVFGYGLGSETGLATFSFYPHVSILSGLFANASEEHEMVKNFLLDQASENDELSMSNEQIDELLEERLTSEQVTCPIKTLSQVLRENEIERIDLLKVDVEKSELDVLNGINEEDWPKIQQVVVEVHDTYDQLKQITGLLKGHGFEVMVEQDTELKNTNLYNVYAVGPHKRRMAPDKVRDQPVWQAGQRWNSPERLVDDLRQLLKEKLPDYMVPSAFVLLETIPLTPNGKIDRKALPEPDTSRPALPESYVVPKTEIEQTIATIWQEVLGLDKVGRHDNFFDLGGHSLRMVQVHSKLKAQFEQDLPLIKLFEHPTIAAMGQFLSPDQNRAVDSPSIIDQVQERAARQKMARAKQRQGRKIRRRQG